MCGWWGWVSLCFSLMTMPKASSIELWAESTPHGGKQSSANSRIPCLKYKTPWSISKTD